MHNCQFENTTTTVRGNISDFNSPFYRNHFVGGGGGAIHVVSGALEVAGSRFTRCSAPYGGGGAVLILDRDDGNLSSSESARRRSGRSESTGGGELQRSGNLGGSGGLYPQLNISSSTFEECSAFAAGGAVAMVNYGKSVGAGVVIVRTNLTHNTVSGERGDGPGNSFGGGGVYMFYSQDMIDSINQTYSGCIFANNSVSSDSKGISRTQSAAYGGGLYLSYSASARVRHPSSGSGSVTASPVSLDGEEAIVGMVSRSCLALARVVVGLPSETKGVCVTKIRYSFGQ